MSYQIELKTAYPALKRSKKKSLIQEGKNQSTIEYDKWHLPGQEPKKSDCGLWSFMGCLNKALHPNKEIFLKPFQKSCFRADCENVASSGSEDQLVRLLKEWNYTKNSLKKWPNIL